MRTINTNICFSVTYNVWHKICRTLVKQAENNKKHDTVMKNIASLLLILLFAMPVLAAQDMHVTDFQLEDEAYVDDIPFDTREVVFTLSTDMEEEAYVNDIPFDTRTVALSAGTELEEEAYVNDIPFNTTDVLLLEGIAMADEAEVDDIPFNTLDVLVLSDMSMLEEPSADDIPFNTLDILSLARIDLQDEEYVNDIPFDTECIVQAVKHHSREWTRCLIPMTSRAMNFDVWSHDTLLIRTKI